MTALIALFTDFGLHDPYVGQMHVSCATQAPGVPVIDLFHAVPTFDVRAGAYLLPAYTVALPTGAVCVAVVDPGVGGTRRALMVRADDRWFVGPDNGLFVPLARRTRDFECREILWRPARLSASFHGRDLFAPVAARLACGEMPESVPAEMTVPDGDWPGELALVVYIDHYGNVITGIREGALPRTAMLRAGGREIGFARVFSEVPTGNAFWYENANGLVEIAVNRGSAATALGLRPGDRVEGVGMQMPS